MALKGSKHFQVNLTLDSQHPNSPQPLSSNQENQPCEITDGTFLYHH